MEPIQAPALPLPGSRSFTQQLAMYNMSSQVPPEELQNPYSDYAVDDLRRSMFDESLANTKTNAGTVFSSVVRHQFMNAFGIGMGFKGYRPLADRIVGAGADYAKDMGSYIYSGKPHGAKATAASKAAGWFVPVQMSKNPSAGRMARLGRSGKAGFKSFLGWNFILGNPEDMSMGDMTMSYLKHTAVSYGIDAAAQWLRKPSSLIAHATTFAKGDPIEAVVGKGGLVDLQGGGYSDKTKKTYARYAKASVRGKKKLYKHLKRSIMNESNRIYLKPDGLAHQDLVGRFKQNFLEAKNSASAAVSESLDGTKLGRATKKAFGGFKDIVNPRDSLAGVTHTGAIKDVFKTTYKAAFKGAATVEDVAESFSTLSSKMMRTTFTLGGAALRIANIASGVVAGGAIAYEGIKYRDKVRQEYVKNMLSDRMTFTMMPEIGMSGTERSRAIEAIQTSGMSLRNYLGNEAQMFH